MLNVRPDVADLDDAPSETTAFDAFGGSKDTAVSLYFADQAKR